MLIAMPNLLDNRFARSQSINNLQTRDAWERCFSHRRRVTALVTAAAAGANGRLCVLGAGNCNDLDLKELLKSFAEIHLVDLDREAVEWGIERQQASIGGAVVIHAPYDLTGVLDRLGSEDVSGLLESIRRPTAGLPSPFHVVLSAGVLTQMFQSIEDVDIPAEATLRLVLAVRCRHLDALLELICSGGASVLISDVVSTTSAPDLAICPEHELAGRLARLIEDRNFFTGANPAAIWQELSGNPLFGDRIAGIEVHDPWLWPVAASRDYLTWALTLRKA
jgi:hypothetical protein